MEQRIEPLIANGFAHQPRQGVEVNYMPCRTIMTSSVGQSWQFYDLAMFEEFFVDQEKWNQQKHWKQWQHTDHESD